MAVLLDRAAAGDPTLAAYGVAYSYFKLAFGDDASDITHEFLIHIGRLGFEIRKKTARASSGRYHSAEHPSYGQIRTDGSAHRAVFNGCRRQISPGKGLE